MKNALSLIFRFYGIYIICGLIIDLFYAASLIMNFRVFLILSLWMEFGLISCFTGIFWVPVFLFLHYSYINQLIFNSKIRSICYSILAHCCNVVSVTLFWTQSGILQKVRKEQFWYNRGVFSMLPLFVLVIPILIAKIDNYIYDRKHENDD